MKKPITFSSKGMPIARGIPRTMRLCVLLIISMLGWLGLGNAELSAQISPTYTFSQSAGTYTSLTGGTVFQSGATISTDAVSTAIALPFSFPYNNRTYSSIHISNNGWVGYASQSEKVLQSEFHPYFKQWMGSLL